MNNLISVIIAAYNGDRYLEEAIDSVLAQKEVEFEIIIVDDGSTDNTSAVIKAYDYPLTAIWQPNQGQGAAFNYALELAQGDVIAFLDQDDIFLPNKLFLQLEILKTNPNIDMVFGHIEQFISPELPDDIKMRREFFAEPMPGCLPSVGMFRKECFTKAGIFDTHWKIGAFIDWYIRAKEQGLKEYMLPEVLTRRRIHDKNQGIVARQHFRHYIQIIKEKLERERASAIHE